MITYDEKINLTYTILEGMYEHNEIPPKTFVQFRLSSFEYSAMQKIQYNEFQYNEFQYNEFQYNDDIRIILEGRLESRQPSSNIHSRFYYFTKGSKKDYENHPVGRSILSGTIDADKLDYLRRDSYHTGSTYGTFDLERMLSTLTTIKDNDKEYPAILEKGIHVLESFRLARYSIYTQVYQHIQDS